MPLGDAIDDPLRLAVELPRHRDERSLQGRFLDRHAGHVPGGDALAGDDPPQRGQQRLHPVHVDAAQGVQRVQGGAMLGGVGGIGDARRVAAGEHVAQGAGLPEPFHEPGREERGDPGLVAGGGREHRPGLGQGGGLEAVQHAERGAQLGGQGAVGRTL